ncbi:MAG TPA: ABC transporter substrate-binding protein, partial [Candidatus Binatus sp.]|nr:ABC transporter substrate-binding protein [Candidatus Binatus sp.]
FKSNTSSAFNEFGKRVGNIPVYARGIRIAALRSVAGVVNMRGTSYPNAFTLMNAHNDTTYTPANPLYSFGGGTNVLRWGQRQGTTQLNPFNAQTLWEFNVVGEVYDTLFAPSPIEPASILCWMCNSYSQSVDVQGNTHFRVELRQNLRWQDGPAVNASDVKFSYLNLRDAPAAALVGNLQQLLTVTILSSTQLDIKMQGQSLSHIVNLAGVPIIPRHIWEQPGDKTYGNVGKVNPSMTSVSYDVITAGTFIGSGPFMCKSVFPSDLGKVGTGCSRNGDGSRGSQSLAQGGSLLVQVFDRTSEPGNSDPFLQYMRSYNSNWGMGTGTVVESGQYQEFRWADRYGNATVSIRDLASVASCYGMTSSTGCTDYSYWLKPALHPLTPNTIGVEVSVVASHLDDTWVAPYSWSGVASSQPGQTLENIVSFTP